MAALAVGIAFANSRRTVFVDLAVAVDGTASLRTTDAALPAQVPRITSALPLLWAAVQTLAAACHAVLALRAQTAGAAAGFFVNRNAGAGIAASAFGTEPLWLVFRAEVVGIETDAASFDAGGAKPTQSARLRQR